MRDACLVCGLSGGNVVYHVRERIYGLPGSWNLWRCTCGHIWLLDPPTEIGEYYPKAASETSLAREPPFDPNAATFERAHYRAHFERSDPSPTAPLLRLLPLRGVRRGMVLARGKRHLDVGCHTGRFLEMTRSFGMEVAGVELDSHAVKAAEKKGLDVHHGTLLDARFASESFEVVTLNHVFEHLPDPDANMRELHRILKPGGTLILATPNPDALTRRVFGEDWVHIDAPRHLHLYSPSVLARLAAKHGFTRARERHLSSYGYLLASARYRRNRRRAHQKSFFEPFGVWDNRWLERIASIPLGLVDLMRAGEEYELWFVKDAVQAPRRDPRA